MFKVFLNGKTVLIIDPEKTSGDILAAKLLNGGFSSSHVHTFASARILLENEEEEFDAVLVCVKKYENALDFIRTIKSDFDKSGKKLPPIGAYSHIIENEKIKQLINCGFSDFFMRPIEPETLWEKVSRLIDHNRKLNAETYSVEISERATATLDLQVVSLNEVGISIHSSVAFDIGVVLGFSIPLLSDTGLASMDARIVRHELLPHPLDNKKYKLDAAFISVSPRQAQEIRKIVRTISLKNKINEEFQ